MEETINYYKSQNTIRLNKDELDYLHENYETIAETSGRITIKDFLLKSVAKAVTSVKPKEIEVSKAEDKEEIELLKSEIERLKNLLSDKENKNTTLLNQLESISEENKAAIVLKFEPKWRKYIWGVLQVSKKQKWAKTYEQLIMFVFKAVNARGELVLTEEDYQYLDTLKYDLEEKTEENE